MEPLALLLLACAGAALCATARAQQHCDSEQFGDTSDDEHSVEEEQRLAPGELFVEIADTDVCGDAKLVGIEVKACDTDRPPRVYLRNTRGLVVREGGLASAAFVYKKVFCATDSNAASHESVVTGQPLSPEEAGVTFEATILPLQSSSTPASPESEYMSKISSTKSSPAMHLQSRFSSKDQVPLPQVPSSISVPLGKRLSRLVPGQPAEWIVNRTPAWVQQPILPPPSPWLMRRSNSDWDARKYMSSYGKKHPTDYILQDSYPQSSLDDVISLHWSEHGASTKSSKTAPFMYHRFLRRPKYTQPHNQNKGSPAYIMYEHTSPTSVSHVIRHQLEVASPIHVEYPDQLTEWKYSHKTQRQVLPVQLLLLQHPNDLSDRMCASAHSVEDDETWWSDLSAQNSVPSLPDYSTDYSAVNVHSQGSYYLPRQEMDNIDRWKLSNLPQRLQFQKVYKEQSSDSTLSKLSGYSPTPEQLPWCSTCVPETPSDGHERHRHRQHHVTFRHSVDTLPGGHHNTDELTERPLTTPAVHHSLSWLKNFKLLSPASPVEPWTLSQLLLAHPTFRDSTQVIRI